jgi:hypothetical protein
MPKTLIRSGNSLALVIDKPLLALANIDETTPVQIGFDGKQLTISPVPPGAWKKPRPVPIAATPRLSKSWENNLATDRHRFAPMNTNKIKDFKMSTFNR